MIMGISLYQATAISIPNMGILHVAAYFIYKLNAIERYDLCSLWTFET